MIKINKKYKGSKQVFLNLVVLYYYYYSHIYRIKLTLILTFFV